MDILLTILFYLFAALLIYRWRFFNHSGISQKKLQGIFLLKFLTGLFLTYIYTKHYPNRSEADIFKYYDDSKVLYNALWEQPVDFFKMLFGLGNETQYFHEQYYTEMNNWDREFDSSLYNDSHTIIRVNAVIRIFSLDVFHIHTLIFTFFGMVGLTAIFRTVKRHFTGKINFLLLALFLVPSVMFWSSGVLKEAILLLGIGLLIYSMHQLLQKERPILFSLVLFISLIILFFIKFYVFIVLFPAVLAWMINQKWKISKPIFSYTIITLFGTMLIFNVEQITPAYNFKDILVQKQHDFKGLAHEMESGSYFELQDIEPNFMSILKTTPEALLNCFIRPLPSKKIGALSWLSIGENLVIVVLICMALFSLLKKNSLPTESLNLFWLCIFFTTLLYVIIGLTTPVAGALVRYKVPALPFFIMGLIQLINLEWFIAKVSLFKWLR